MQIGDVIAGQFLVESRVAAGGMGAVYRARSQDGEAVALKCMLAGQASARFTREAEILAHISHPGVVRYLGHGQTPDGEAWLAMEWLEGEDLAALLGRRVLTVEEAVGLGVQVARALEVAHGLGVVHRDLKPANMFLVHGDVARVKLLDFGIAKAVASATLLTATGAVVGTPAYMAPEQVRGSALIDARADVFSLASVLFECLTGRTPFGGDHFVAVMAKIVLEPAPLVFEVRRDVPLALGELLGKMFSKDPQARPDNGASVARALQALDMDLKMRTGVWESAVGALSDAEQRVACVVLTEGATGIDATVDSGSVAVDEEIRAAVQGAGGRLEVLANGSYLAVFSSQGAVRDVIARAAPCALAVADRLAGRGVALSLGREVVRGAQPLGALIDESARLLNAAKGGGVVVGEGVAHLLPEALEGEQGQGGEWRLRRSAAQGEALQAERLLLGRPAAFVGRDRDLGALVATVDESLDDNTARVVCVTAEAGLGKSRLLRELLRRVEDRALVLVARANSEAAGAPFALAGQLVWRAASLDARAHSASNRDKLRAYLEALRPADGHMTEFLCELSGLAVEEQHASARLRAARGDTRAMNDALRACWLDWFEALCAQGPVLVVLEDLHWGDLPSVELLDATLLHCTEQPLCVVATARPEVHQVFPKLWAKRGLQEVRLNPITRRAAEHLVRGALGSAASAKDVQLIVERAAGHPFLLEELVRAVASGVKDALPETVLGMVQLRIQALDPEDRRVLRAASVFGEAFTPDAILGLVGGSEDALTDRLDGLVRSEVLTQREGFCFRHALVRDAAYAMLTEADRTAGHLLAGRWLAAGSGGSDAEPLMVAQHFEKGGDTVAASPWLKRAAERAMEGGDLVAAVRHAERALAWAADAATRASLNMVLSEAALRRGEAKTAAHYAQAAADDLEPQTEGWFRATGARINALGQCRDNAAVAALFEQIQTPQTDPDALHAQLWCACQATNQLLWLFNSAQTTKCMAYIDQLIGQCPSPPLEIVAWVERLRMLISALYDWNFSVAFGHATRSLAAFDAVGLLRVGCAFRSMVACLICMIRPEEALVIADQAVEGARKLGSDLVMGTVYIYTAQVWLIAGQAARAEASCREALPLLGDNGALLNTAQSFWIMSAFAQGKRAECSQIARQFRPEPLRIRENWLAGICQAGMALEHLDQGRIAEAVAEVEGLEALSVPPSLGAFCVFVMVARVILEVYEASGDPTRAQSPVNTLLERAATFVRRVSQAEDQHIIWQSLPIQSLLDTARAARLTGWDTMFSPP